MNSKIKIGIICPSEIALRRFMPSIQKCDGAAYIGVASANASEWSGGNEPDPSVIENEAKKAQTFADNYGGKVFGSYGELLSSDEVDAVYLPLPPALHYQWAELALEHGKHVFLEKPSTTSAADTKELTALAQNKNLALRENYMFVYHRQLEEIGEVIESGRIGDVRLYRLAFGFPERSRGDFRYNKSLGGGALLDCGGYTLKLADILLGGKSRVAYAQLNSKDGYDVDLYGSGALVNEDGVTAQVSFGMDNSYKCELEVWGSKGCLRAGRIFTAPAGFTPTVEITTADGTKTVQLTADDSFLASIERFCLCIHNTDTRAENYRILNRQAELVESFRNLAKADKRGCNVTV